MRESGFTTSVVQEFRDMVKRGRGRPRGKRDVVRVTVVLEPEVYETFKRMSETAAMSLSRTIGDWCRDTAEGAQFVTEKMVQARKAPAVVMREMHAAATGMLDEIQRLQRDAAAHRRRGTRERDAGAGGGS